MNEEQFLQLKPSDKNRVIGELISGTVLYNYFLQAGDAFLWSIFQPDDVAAFERNIKRMQASNADWAAWKKDNFRLDDSMRGKITLGKSGYHIRYSETPGGGWMVVEFLRAAGYKIQITTPSENKWAVHCQKAMHDRLVSRESDTMEMAACLLALQVL